MANYLSLSLREAMEVTLDAWQADPRSAPLWIGPPGIGKTEAAHDLALAIAQILGPRMLSTGLADPRKSPDAPFPTFDLCSLEVAHCAEEDIGGIPVRDTASGEVKRLPMGPLHRASTHASVLHLDEVSRASTTKQGTLLTVTNEGRAGDFSLNPWSRVLLAANGAESTGSHTIIEALLNRCLVIQIVPKVDEALAYLINRVGDPSSTLRELAIDYALTAQKAPGLIETEPPPNASESGLQWASPRAIVKALKVFDQSLQNKRTGEVLFAGLAGYIGKEAAGRYISIRKIREHLPSVEEIVANPKAAKVPEKDNVEAGIGVMGLVGVAASRNPDAAWIYNSRMLGPESKRALSKMLCMFPPKTPEGRATKLMLLGEVGVANEA